MAGLLLVGCAQPRPIRVMSLNARASEGESENAWGHRQESIVSAVAEQRPDVLALQHVHRLEVASLKEALPDFSFVAVGDSSATPGADAMPIFFRTERFTLVDYGQYELVEESNRGRRRSGLPAVASWARLRIKEAPLEDLQVVNVQLCGTGQEARVEAAEIIRRWVESLGMRPMIVLGSFECHAGSRPYQILTEDRKNLAALTDPHTWADEGRALPPDGAKQVWSGHCRMPRTDWILVNRRFEPLQSDAVGAAGPLRRPPLTATLQLCRPGQGHT